MLHELYEAHEDDEPVDLATIGDDPMIARSLMIELQVNEKRAEQLRAALGSIEGVYKGRLAKLADRAEQIRESLEVYVERNGKLSFPDVGSLHLQKRQASVRVVEPEAFAGWLIGRGLSAAVSVEQTYKFPAGAKTVASQAMRADGEMPRGCELVPEGQSLVIKKAAG